MTIGFAEMNMIGLYLAMIGRLRQLSDPSLEKISDIYRRGYSFLTYGTGFFSIFSDAGISCLAHRLRQLTRDTICDVSCLKMSLTRRNEKTRMTLAIMPR